MREVMMIMNDVRNKRKQYKQRSIQWSNPIPTWWKQMIPGFHPPPFLPSHPEHLQYNTAITAPK